MSFYTISRKTSAGYLLPVALGLVLSPGETLPLLAVAVLLQLNWQDTLQQNNEYTLE